MWHYSITEEEKADIERVQKVACKVILKERYSSYENALLTLDLQTLSERRDILCLRFAKKCLKMPQTKDMFPVNPPDLPNVIQPEKFKVQFAHNGRLRDSAIPQLQRALNSDTIKS